MKRGAPDPAAAGSAPTAALVAYGALVDDLFGDLRLLQRQLISYVDGEVGVLLGRCAAWHAGRIGAEQRLAVAVINAFDQVRLDLVTAIGEGGPALSDFHGGQAGSAECQ